MNRNRFRPGPLGNKVITCKECKKRTTTEAGQGTGLCGRCYDRAGLENEHLDGGHDDATHGGCPLCMQPEGRT